MKEVSQVERKDMQTAKPEDYDIDVTQYRVCNNNTDGSLGGNCFMVDVNSSDPVISKMVIPMQTGLKNTTNSSRVYSKQQHFAPYSVDTNSTATQQQLLAQQMQQLQLQQQVYNIQQQRTALADAAAGEPLVIKRG